MDILKNILHQKKYAAIEVGYLNMIINRALLTIITWLCPGQVKISSVTLGALLEGTGGRNDREPPNTGHYRTSSRDDGLSGEMKKPKQGKESHNKLYVF